MWTAAQCHQHYMSTPQYLSFLVSFLGVYGFKVLQFTVTYQVDFHPNFSHPWQYFTTSLLTRENRVSANGWTHPSSMTTVVVHSFIRKVTIVTLTILYSVVEVQDFNYTIADHFRGIYRIFSQLNKEKPEDVNLWLDGLGNTDWYIYIWTEYAHKSLHPSHCRKPYVTSASSRNCLWCEFEVIVGTSNSTTNDLDLGIESGIIVSIRSAVENNILEMSANFLCGFLQVSDWIWIPEVPWVQN